MSRTDTSEGQALWQPGGAEENSHFCEGDRCLHLAYTDKEEPHHFSVCFFPNVLYKTKMMIMHHANITRHHHRDTNLIIIITNIIVIIITIYYYYWYNDYYCMKYFHNLCVCMAYFQCSSSHKVLCCCTNSFKETFCFVIFTHVHNQK